MALIIAKTKNRNSFCVVKSSFNSPKPGRNLIPGGHHILLKQATLFTTFFIVAAVRVFAQPPSASFIGVPQANCPPVIVNFYDQSTGNPTSWYWDFGNGNSSTLQNPVATYFTPGTYTVSLTATNAAGSNTMTRTQYITVHEPPVPAFSANILSGCFPLRVQFTDNSTADRKSVV